MAAVMGNCVRRSNVLLNYSDNLTYRYDDFYAHHAIRYGQKVLSFCIKSDYSRISCYSCINYCLIALDEFDKLIE